MHLLVIFTAASSPTISSTDYEWHTSQVIIITLFIKDGLAAYFPAVIHYLNHFLLTII